MKRKRIAWLVGGLLVLGAGGWWATHRGPEPTTVQVATVGREDLQAKVTANGKVQAQKKGTSRPPFPARSPTWR